MSSTEEADEERKRGNAAMGERDFARAEECYTRGLALDPSSHVLHGNRSAARFASGDFAGALSDAETAVRLCPSYAKAHHRRGVALLALKRPDDAVSALEDALQQASSDETELFALLTRAVVERARAAGDAANAETFEELSSRAFDLRSDAAAREAFAAFVVACERGEISDARLAAAARNVVCASAEGAAGLRMFHGALEALVAVAERAAERKDTKALVDATHALAAATAGSAEGKTALVKAGVLGLVRRVLGSSGAGLLQKLMEQSDSAGVRNVLEAVADIASHSDEVRGELHDAGVVPVLLELCLPSYSGAVRAMAASALGTLCELDKIRSELLGLGIVSLLVSMLLEENAEDGEKDIDALDALRVIVETPDGAKAVIEHERALDAIFARVPARESAARLVFDLASKDHASVPTQSLVSHVPRLVHAASSIPGDVVAQKNTAAALSGLAANRAEAAEAVLTHGKELFTQWTRQVADRELRAAGIMLLANVARTEFAVAELDSAIDMLVRLVDEECDRQEIADDTHLLLASLAALRNFAVPRPNRERLAEAGLIRACIRALQNAARKDLRVAFEAEILILSVIRGSPRRASMVPAADPAGALQTILAIAKGDPVREGDKPVVVVDKQGHRDMRVQLEASRLVAELCCSLDPAGAQTLWDLGALAALQLLARSKFDVLRTEAARAASALRTAGIEVPSEL